MKERIHLTKRAYRMLTLYCPKLIQISLLQAVVTAVQPFVGIWFSARIISEISGDRDFRKLLWMVAAVVILQFVISAWKSWLDTLRGDKEAQMWGYFEKIFSDKQLDLDYADVENAEVQNRKAWERENLFQYGNGLGQFVWSFRGIVEGFVSVLGSLLLVGGLFISRCGKAWLDSPIWIGILIVVIMLGALANSWAARKENTVFSRWCREAEPYHRGFRLYGWELCTASERAKDVRIYRQYETAGDYLAMMTDDAVVSGQRYFRKRSVYEAAAAFGVGLEYVVMYLFTVLKCFWGAFGVGSILQYVGAMRCVSSGIQQLLFGLTDNAIYTKHLKSLFEFLDIPSRRYKGSLPVEKRAFCHNGDNEYTIAFQDVSFRYPASDTYALRHVSLEFHIGEKLALVGENGSGKTTLVKLLCRLYDPTEGAILLNGIDIRKYAYEEYISILAVVFQDFRLFALPLGQNIAAVRDYDQRKAEICLEKAGFAERLQTMERGLDTCLYKDYDEQGEDLSGGETQKIAIARALYRDAPFIILDEPTAALDPIAEYEVYSRFNDMIGGKTAVYISHRLSSCRFCDEIAVFDQGRVVQRGTHEQLVADASGTYYKLWSAQAQYYMTRS